MTYPPILVYLEQKTSKVKKWRLTSVPKVQYMFIIHEAYDPHQNYYCNCIPYLLIINAMPFQMLRSSCRAYFRAAFIDIRGQHLLQNVNYSTDCLFHFTPCNS